MAEYIVGPRGEYREIQAALDALIVDQGVSSFTETHTISILEGSYKPFKIPEGLTPTSTFRLEIQGPRTSFGKIIGSLARDRSFTGINIPTPNITLSNLIVTECTRGIFLQEGADSAILGNLILYRNANTGIWSYKADDTFIYNSIIRGSAFGIAGVESQNFSLFHSTILSTTIQREEAVTCVYLKGASTPGTMTLRNNILYAGAGRCITLRPQDLDDVDSDYNNLFAPGGNIGKVLGQEERATLARWRQRTNLDGNSVAIDPGFIQAEVHKKGVFGLWLDLDLLNTSPIANLGEDPSSGSYPSNVDTGLLGKDILGKNRSNTPTLGANEILVKSSFYGDEIFDPQSSSDPCGPAATITDLAITQHKKSTRAWYPKLRTGYFHVRDHDYWLYSNEKQSKTLGQITYSTFELSVVPISSSFTVRLAGEEVTDWNTRGTTLIVPHGDHTVTTLDEEVEVTGEYNLWDTGNLSFTATGFTETLKLKDGTQRYLLDPPPSQGAPIVITDDTIGYGEDIGHLPLGYYVNWADDLSAAEVTFQNTNILENPQFEYGTEDWAVTGDLVTVTSGLSIYGGKHHPRIGHSYALLGTGEINQIVDHYFETGSAYTIQAYAFPTDTGEDHDLDITLEFYDETGNALSSESWSRAISNSAWVTPAVIAETGVPDLATQAIIKFSTTGELGLEATSLEAAPEGGRYSRLPRPGDMTIEWEGGQVPNYEIRRLNMNPVVNTFTNGFLAIQNLPARQFDGAADTGASTLEDWKWPNGRLSHLPWAKVSGKNKWRGIERSSAAELPKHVGYTAPRPEPRNIEVYPSPVLTYQGDTGVGVAAQVTDRIGNPLAFGDVRVRVWEGQNQHPGYLATKEFGAYTKLGTTMTLRSNSAGTLALEYVPPTEGDVRLDTPVLKSDHSVTGAPVRYFATKYKVSPIGYGNITISDDTGASLSLTGEVVTNTYTGILSDEIYFYPLTTYPSLGSISVKNSDDIYLTEVYSPSLQEGEFFVNYENKTIQALEGETLTVTHTPILAFGDTRYPYRIFITNDVVLPGDYIVGYDAIVNLSITARGNPDKWIETDIICRNPTSFS